MLTAVPENSGRIRQAELLAGLPDPWPEPALVEIQRLLKSDDRTVVVLDDDPTGTQTVHGVTVLTDWSIDTLQCEFALCSRVFFILTNSRALSEPDARRLTRSLAENLRDAARLAQREFVVISRSDSTLRGHFPAETDELAAMLGPFSATFLLPYFDAGGRLTIGDQHYVAEDGWLTPAGETPFARDATFGYRHSNLRDWISEKSHGRISANEIESITLAELRESGPSAVATRLGSLPEGTVAVVNAAHRRDMEVFTLAALMAEHGGRRFLYRSAASFAGFRAGIAPRPLLERAEITLHADAATGGLVVVGSHVPKTSAQLEHYRQHRQPEAICLEAGRLLNPESRDGEIARAAQAADHSIGAGRDTVLFTSRDLISGSTPNDSLAISRSISDALVATLRSITRQPRWVVAKGGITSSDIATRALVTKRAEVLGQIHPGVPLWRLDPQSRWPGIPYVVFPGNVGDAAALTAAIARLP
ncbi:MAG: four-carbon acid sugar kinase family protein [Opitutaceae bacterium]